jgi:predicted esterase
VIQFLGRREPRGAAAAAVLAAVLASGAVAGRAEELPAGALVPRVVARDDASESYALYLPSSYSSGRSWPILYALDARGRGSLAAEVFVPAAETYGWIVASSNTSRSDGPMEPNVKALRTMWRDTHDRLAIDAKRAYITGFSGGARAACLMADTSSGAVAGVIAVGAGFSPDRPPRGDLSFSVYGLSGDADFNFGELQALDATLDGLGVSHRVESFEGGHAWPPTAAATAAVEWMEVQAIKEGRRPRDDALLEALLARQADAARGLESAGLLLEASHAYRAAARQFGGLRDVSEIEQAAARLGASERVRGLVAARERRLKAEADYRQRAAQAFADVTPEAAPSSLKKVVGRLDIDALKKQAQSGDREESLSARRQLASVYVQTAFYVPRTLLERKDYPRAVLSLSVAREIEPEDPGVWFGLARAQAGQGRKGEALEALNRAVDLGFSSLERLESEPDLEGLRGTDGYRALVARLKGS